jgi:hypothetical protein
VAEAHPHKVSCGIGGPALGRPRKIKGRPGGRSGLTYPGGGVKKEQTWLTQCHEVAEVAVVAANGRVGGPAAYEYGR